MDRSVSCWNQFSVQLSFPIVCSSGVSPALSDKAGAFSLGDGPGFSSAVYLSKRQPGILYDHPAALAVLPGCALGFDPAVFGRWA